jgi:RimJ/RimL family protein N-acetyltransferase
MSKIALPLKAGPMGENRISMGIRIETERFVLRELTAEDATPIYLGWFRGPESANIVTAGDIHDLADLRAYISSKSGRKDILFLGIFEKETDSHIGNLKYEPINSGFGYAILGIFVGDSKSRGLGVAQEAITASASWLKDNRAIKEIVLGVAKSNLAAIKAYEKTGFKIASTPHLTSPRDDIQSMVWVL